MINTEIKLILKWSQNWVLTGKATRAGLDAEDNNGEVLKLIPLQT